MRLHLFSLLHQIQEIHSIIPLDFCQKTQEIILFLVGLPLHLLSFQCLSGLKLLLERTVYGHVWTVSTRLTLDVVLFNDLLGACPDSVSLFVTILTVVVSQHPCYCHQLKLLAFFDFVHYFLNKILKSFKIIPTPLAIFSLYNHFLSPATRQSRPKVKYTVDHHREPPFLC
jgi:hypothetical protein